MKWVPPARLAADFEFLRPLGHGGMGHVFLVRHLELDRLAAIKLIKGAEEPARVRRFLREARALGRVEHPTIPKVFSFGETDQGPYLEMEWVQGKNMADMPEDADPMPWMLQVAEGLEAVHAAGLVHRDVKPDNILVTDEGRAVLVDFGLAFDSSQDRLTQSGQFVGTLAYLSPEVLQSQPPSPASDWFAWGVTLFYMYERQVPYALPLVVQAAGGLPLPPLEFRRLDPESAEAEVLRQALSKDPEARPRSRADVEQLLARLPTPPEDTSPSAVDFRRDSGPATQMSGASLTAPALALADTQTPATLLRSRALASVMGVGLALLAGMLLLPVLGTAPPVAPSPPAPVSPVADPSPAGPPAGSPDPTPLPSPLPTPAEPSPPTTTPGRPKATPTPTPVAPLSSPPPLSPPDGPPPSPGDLPAGAVLRLGSARLRHTEAATVARFSPDGAWLASAGYDNQVLLWEAATGDLRGRLGGHGRVVYDLDFHPDGELLATGGDDGAVHLFEVATGTRRARYATDLGEVRSLRFAAGGTELLVGGADGRLLRLATADGAPRPTPPLPAPGDRPRPPVLAPGGAGVVVQQGDKLVLLDGTRGPVGRPLPATRVRGGVALAPDGHTLAVPDQDADIHVVDMRQARITATLRGHEDAPVALAFSRDGTWLASASLDRSIRVWDTATGHQAWSFPTRDPWIGGLGFSPDGGQLVAAVGGRLRVFDLAGGRELFQDHGHQAAISAMAFAEGGRTLVTAGADGRVQTWDLSTGTWSQELGRMEKPVSALAIDGDTVLTGGADPDVVRWDLGLGGERARLGGHGSGVEAMAMSPDGTTLASGGRDGTLLLWDMGAADPLPRQWLDAHDGAVTAIAWDPASAWLVTAGADGELHTWDARGGDLRGALVVPGGGPAALAVTPDGQALLGAGRDGSVLRWRCTSLGPAAAEPARWAGHAGPVRTLAIQPDGAAVISGSDDGLLVRHRLPGGEPDLRWQSHQGKVGQVLVAPRGGRVASGGEDGTVLLWDLR